MSEPQERNETPTPAETNNAHWVRSGRLGLLYLAVLAFAVCGFGGVALLVTGRGSVTAALLTLVLAVGAAFAFPFALRNVRSHWHDGGL